MYHTASNDNGSHSLGKGYNGNRNQSISHHSMGAYAAPPQDRKNDETRSNSSKTSKSRGWRVLASAVRASKACKRSTADVVEAKNGAAGKGLFYEPLVDNVGGEDVGTQNQRQRQQDGFQPSGAFYPPGGGRQLQEPLLQQQQRHERGHGGPGVGEGTSRSSSAPGGEKGASRDSAARQSAAAAWENLQLMSGLSLGDAVTVVSGALLLLLLLLHSCQPSRLVFMLSTPSASSWLCNGDFLYLEMAVSFYILIIWRVVHISFHWIKL